SKEDQLLLSETLGQAPDQASLHEDHDQSNVGKHQAVLLNRETILVLGQEHQSGLHVGEGKGRYEKDCQRDPQPFAGEHLPVKLGTHDEALVSGLRAALWLRQEEKRQHQVKDAESGSQKAGDMNSAFTDTERPQCWTKDKAQTESSTD